MLKETTKAIFKRIEKADDIRYNTLQDFKVMLNNGDFTANDVYRYIGRFTATWGQLVTGLLAAVNETKPGVIPDGYEVSAPSFFNETAIAIKSSFDRFNNAGDILAKYADMVLNHNDFTSGDVHALIGAVGNQIACSIGSMIGAAITKKPNLDEETTDENH